MDRSGAEGKLVEASKTGAEGRGVSSNREAVSTSARRASFMNVCNKLLHRLNDEIASSSSHLIESVG